MKLSKIIISTFLGGSFLVVTASPVNASGMEVQIMNALPGIAKGVMGAGDSVYTWWKERQAKKEFENAQMGRFRSRPCRYEEAFMVIPYGDYGRSPYSSQDDEFSGNMRPFIITKDGRRINVPNNYGNRRLPMSRVSQMEDEQQGTRPMRRVRYVDPYGYPVMPSRVMRSPYMESYDDDMYQPPMRYSRTPQRYMQPMEVY